ncbi:MAG: hypothetical protein FRX49_09665 [Trebouxia sp. A1-2]|nr:MAG: hypothetical protein FRX49_09665 [Trebouxia sp. A1-2]
MDNVTQKGARLRAEPDLDGLLRLLDPHEGSAKQAHATAIHLSHLVRRGDAGSSAAFGVPPSAPRKSHTTPSTLEGLRRVKNEGPGATSSKPSILGCRAAAGTGLCLAEPAASRQTRSDARSNIQREYLCTL